MKAFLLSLHAKQIKLPKFVKFHIIRFVPLERFNFNLQVAGIYEDNRNNALKAGYMACRVRNIKLLQEIAVWGYFEEILYFASYFNWLTGIKFAINCGAVNYDEACVFALRAGSTEAAIYLVRLGLTRFTNVLSVSIKTDNVKIFSAILRRVLVDMDEILEEAALHGSLRIVVVACGRGANNYDDALFAAAANGHIAVASYLIDSCEGARDIQPALEVACVHGQLGMVKYLATCGDYFLSPLVRFAAENGHNHIIEFFHEQKLTRYFGYGLCLAGRANHLHTVKLFAQYLDNDPLKKQYFNETLVQASGAGNFEIVKYLVEECGANAFQRALLMGVNKKIGNYIIKKIN